MKTWVVMANDYPVGVALSEEGAKCIIDDARERQRARYYEVESSPARVEERLKFYHLRAYEFEAA